MRLPHRNAHLADPTLLLLFEGELRGGALRYAQRHLATCSACRLRRDALMEASDLVLARELVNADKQVSPGPSAAARERLALLLAEQSDERGPFEGLRRWSMLRPSVWLRAGFAVVLLAVAVLWRQLDLPLQDRMAAYEETGPKPNHLLTPGSASPAALNQLCGLSDFDLDPRVSPEKARAVFRAYGLSERAARAYQVDYLINPQLGGNDHMENLWPEPYHATIWNASAKDALEARLHGMVCSGQIDLQAAQRELSTDWIAAYKKYFGTQRPVSTLAELDRPRTLEVLLPR